MSKRIVVETIHGTLEVTGQDRRRTHLCVGMGPSIWYSTDDLAKANAYASRYKLVVVFNPERTPSR